jgi:hypothetical protein
MVRARRANLRRSAEPVNGLVGAPDLRRSGRAACPDRRTAIRGIVVQGVGRRWLVRRARPVARWPSGRAGRGRPPQAAARRAGLELRVKKVLTPSVAPTGWLGPRLWYRPLRASWSSSSLTACVSRHGSKSSRSPRTSLRLGVTCWRSASASASAPMRHASPSRVSAAPGACGCRCPLAASTVRASGPSLSAGRADLAQDPSRCLRNRTPRQGPRCGRMLAGRYCPPQTPPQPLQPVRGHRGRRSLTIHAPPPAAAVGIGRRLPTLPGWPGCVRNGGHLAMPSGRLDGRHGAGVQSTAELDAASVRGPPLLPGLRPVSGRRVSATDTTAVCGVRC